MHKLVKLKPGDHVEIIAPASRCTDSHLKGIESLLTSWDLKCIVSADIFGDDLLCANSDAVRFELLKKALFNPVTKAVICARGGYGSMRLIPELSKLKSPDTSKLFVGMSDITALNLFLTQSWEWPVIHGALSQDKYSLESLTAVKSLLFGEVNQVVFTALPLNWLAEKNLTLNTSITGGNLSLVQTSLETLWEIDSTHKILFLEEIGERGYRIDRMLEHLHQAAIFQKAQAVIFGDFLEGNEPNGTSLILPVLKRFAEACHIPVMQIKGIGHGHTNFPIPLGTPVQLNLGKLIRLICSI